jgi:hypothetical protein
MSTSILNGAKVTANVIAVVTVNLAVVAMLVYPALTAAGYRL